MASRGKTPKEKVKKLGLFKNFRKSTTDLSEWNKNDEKILKAVENGDSAKVDSILTKKTIVTTKLGPKGLSIFHVACALGKIQILEQLLGHGADVNVLTIQGCTALQLSAANGQAQIVHRLIQAGAVIEHKDGNNLTALHHACIGPNTECVQVLLQNGAEVTARDKTGKTPLFYAAHGGDIQICKELLDRGSDPNTCDNHKITPLMAAAKKGRTDVCDLLLKKGADQSLADIQGKKAIDYGSEEGFKAELQEIFEKAPTRASWDLHTDGQTESPGAEGGPDLNTSASEMPEADQVDVVAQFIPDNSPKLERKLPVTETPPPQPHTLTLPPSFENGSISINQKVAEAFKELEEEHEQLNEDYHLVRTENQRLQGQVDSLQHQLSQLREKSSEDLENEVVHLQSRLSEEQQRYQQLQEQITAKHSAKTESAADDDTASMEDAWNDNEEDLFDSPVRKSEDSAPDNKQMMALLRSQILTLRQENEQLKSQAGADLPTKTNSSQDTVDAPHSPETLIHLKNQLMEKDNDLEELHNRLITLEEENKILLNQIKMNRKNEESSDEIVVTANGNAADLSHDSGDKIVKQSEEKSLEKDQTVQPDTAALQQECEELRHDLETLRDTYEKLVQAGDNLQEMYDQIYLEKEMQAEELEKLSQEKEDLVKDNEFLLSDGNALHNDLEKLVQELETLQETNTKLQEEKEDLDRKLGAVNMSGKASEMAKLMEERDKYKERFAAVESERNKLREDHEVVLEEVQSMQEQCQRMTQEQETMQQEFESVQDDYDQIQQQNEMLQQDYQQLEHDYGELLADKEKLEQEFLEVQTASVQVDSKGAAQEELQQENNLLKYEKEQLELTITEMSRNNALLEEKLNKQRHDLSKTQEQLKRESAVRVKQESESTTDKDKLIKSLQIQLSRLQQQLSETDRHHRDVVNTYRTHLLSAVQGHMDPDVQQVLYNIIDLRSVEEYC